MIPRIFAGQSNFGRILKSPTLLTRSKALVRSINEMYIFHVIVWWIISNQQFNVCPGKHSVAQDKLPLQALGVAFGQLKQFFSDGKECDALLVEAVSPVPMSSCLIVPQPLASADRISQSLLKASSLLHALQDFSWKTVLTGRLSRRRRTQGLFHLLFCRFNIQLLQNR